MNNIIRNSVKLLEVRMTEILRKELGSISYDWTQSPVRVLRGKSAEFILTNHCSGETWDGEVRLAGGTSLKIKLNRVNKYEQRIEERTIRICC